MIAIRTLTAFLLSSICALATAQSGTLDLSFDPGDGPNDEVYRITVQPDGKILISGIFTEYAGVARGRVARINADGSLDTSFDPGTGANDYIDCITLQPDGKILVGGSFTSFNGATCLRIARLNADGSLDPTFQPLTGVTGNAYTWVARIVLQPDGKILIGGGFTAYDGAPRSSFARLHADGTVDPAFGEQIPLGLSTSDVRGLTLLPDGRILMSGSFTSYNWLNAPGIVRINSDASRDLSFVPAQGPTGGSITDMILLPDDRILISGSFTGYAGTGFDGIGRLNSDGTADVSFTDNGAEDVVAEIARQSDGRILVVGNFLEYANVPRSRIARVTADGILDASFDPGAGANGVIQRVYSSPEGWALISGLFTEYDGIPRNRIARIFSDVSTGVPDASAPATEQFRFDAQQRTVQITATDGDPAAQAVLLDATGRTLAMRSGPVRQFDLQGMGAGVYLVRTAQRTYRFVLE